MAFGRSNSLSINTGATNSLFAQQQANNPSSQPPAPSGLFGSSTQQSTQAGNLFGGPATHQRQGSISGPSGGGAGLFGNTAASQPQQSGTLFGNTATSQPQQSGSLFGSTLGNAQSTQQSSASAGLFGGALKTPAQPAPQQQSGGLFGSSNQPAQQQQPQQQSGGLFASLNQQPAQQQQQPQQAGSLFGGSLFGNTAPQQQPTNSIFGASTQNQNQPQQQQQQSQMGAPQNSIFGLSANAPSLLGASQYRSTQYQPFAGKLTMGQQHQAASAVPGAQQQPPVGGALQGAVKINYDDLRPTTRYTDCIDDLQRQLEAIDAMIQAQERFCREIESFIPAHGVNVGSLAGDVEMVREKCEAVEGGLAMDAAGVEGQRKVLVEKDGRDGRRVGRVVGSLGLPVGYRYTGSFGGVGQQVSTTAYPGGSGVEGEDVAKDMDLISNFFTPLTSDLKKTLETYTANLSEIESHMRVIEHSTVLQAQQLAAKRAGTSGAGNSEDTVRELADTLRGFEASILGAASLVGECREGVNELVVGRFGGELRRR